MKEPENYERKLMSMRMLNSSEIPNIFQNQKTVEIREGEHNKKLNILDMDDLVINEKKQKNDDIKMHSSSRIENENYIIYTKNIPIHKGYSIQQPYCGCTNQLFDPIYKKAKIEPENSYLTVPVLSKIFDQYLEFPVKNRFLVWRFLLKLPSNHEHFDNLIRYGEKENIFENLWNSYPIHPQRLYNRVHRILTAFSNYKEFFKHLEYLPEIVYPFAKVIENNDTILFETLLMIIINYHFKWYLDYPTPPHDILMKLQEIVFEDCPQIAFHLKKMDCTSLHFLWPILKSMFSELLKKKDWLSIWDFLVLKLNLGESEMFYGIAASCVISLKSKILNTHNPHEVHHLVSSHHEFIIKDLISNAKRLKFKIKEKMYNELKYPIQFLEKKNYPLFSDYSNYYKQ